MGVSPSFKRILAFTLTRTDGHPALKVLYTSVKPLDPNQLETDYFLQPFQLCY